MQTAVKDGMITMAKSLEELVKAGKLMLVQEKNIKGFNLLELIVVLVIVGIISATAYPNFSKWKKREVRRGAAKIQSLIKNINSQIDKERLV